MQDFQMIDEAMSVTGIRAVMRGLKRICFSPVLALLDDDPISVHPPTMQTQAALLGQVSCEIPKPIGNLTLNSPVNRTV